MKQKFETNYRVEIEPEPPWLGWSKDEAKQREEMKDACRYIRVRLDGEKRVRRYHPTDRVEYLGILVKGELMKIGQAKGGE